LVSVHEEGEANQIDYHNIVLVGWESWGNAVLAKSTTTRVL